MSILNLDGDIDVKRIVISKIDSYGFLVISDAADTEKNTTLWVSAGMINHSMTVTHQEAIHAIEKIDNAILQYELDKKQCVKATYKES